MAMGDLLIPLSTCKRLQVSTIIFPTDCSMVYSIGFNGQPRGIDNNKCNGQDGEYGCGCLHAEQNALMKFNMDTSKPSLLYVTYPPCIRCASLILNCTKIIGVLYKNPHHNRKGTTLLEENAIRVVRARCFNQAHHVFKEWKVLV